LHFFEKDKKKMWIFTVVVSTILATSAAKQPWAADQPSARIIRPSKSAIYSLTTSQKNNYYTADGYQDRYRKGYNSEQKYPSNDYLQENESSLEQVDQIADKNFDAPPVATATTGGWPFISYAVRGIAWLFVVGTLFLMFVGTVSAAFYRWSKAVASGRRFDDAEVAEAVMKAVDRWNAINF